MATEPHKYQQETRNYSTDEMMARLKKENRKNRHHSSDSEGELVTREDGTQVVKMRKRKRRSKQPEKEQKRLNPKVKWLIVGSIFGLGALLLASSVFIIAKYNGRSFKESTETSITELAGAQKSEITQLRVTPVSAKAAKYNIDWGAHSFLKNAELNNLRADIKATSFFTKSWIGEEVVASAGKVYFQKPASLTEITSESIISPYSFGSYRCNQLDIHFGEERGAPAILGLQISLRQMISEKYQFVFQDGTMKIPNWPELKLSSGVITLNSQDAEIEALLAAGSGLNGELTIAGNIPKNTQKKIVLDIKAKDYPMQELLGEELGRLIHGTVQSDIGSLSYDYQKPSAEGLSFILPFNSTDIQLSDLPFLTNLKNITGNTTYSRPIFTNCRGNIMRTSEGVSLNNITWISNSIITLTGDIQVAANKKLSGTLNLGIPSSAFESEPPAPFVGPKDGLYHATINLSGTIHNPHDNLRELIQLHSGAEVPVRLPKSNSSVPLTPKEKMEEDFEDLIR